MNFELNVFQSRSVDDFMQSSEFVKFNERCKRYEDSVKSQLFARLENDAQKMVFVAWCTGHCVDCAEYRKANEVSEYDFEKAKTAILCMCSSGLG